MRGDKGNVETADEEPRVEQPIARMAPRPEQRLQQRTLAVRPGRMCAGTTRKAKGQQHNPADQGCADQKGRLPTCVDNHPLHPGHEGEGPKRPGRGDDAKCRAAVCRVDDAGDGSQYDHIGRATEPQADNESQRQIQTERATTSRHQQAPSRVEQRTS